MEDRPLGGGVSIRDWIEGGRVPRLDRGLAFPALSLDAQRKPVAVMNSDCSFRLFLSNPAPEELEEILTILELPFPLGLAHPVGFLVANPALSSRPDHWASLDNHGYHGAVVWGWQDAMMTLGLARQARREDLSTGVKDRIRALVGQSRAQRRAAGPLTASELWTWSVSGGVVQARPFGVGDQDETESNAIQLWSSASLPLARLD
jgi:hypothetical protein